MRLIIGAIAGLSAASAFAQGSDQPAPERTAGISLAETAVRSELKDPESAHFSWPYPFRYGTFKLGRSIEGWITCGTVNAKNGFGGYSGSRTVLIVYRDGAVQVALIESAGLPLLAKYCSRFGMPAY